LASVVLDVALFVGDIMCERNATLYWEMHTRGKTMNGYQAPIISTDSPPFKGWYVVPEDGVLVSMQRWAKKLPMKTTLVDWVRAVVDKTP
jgi:hypothetical protein